MPEKPKADPTAAKRLTGPERVEWPKATVTQIADNDVQRVYARPQIAVQTFERVASQRAGVSGPIMRVNSGSGAVKLSYAPYEHAFGGDWGARLRLVQLPSCALTTPELPQCRTITPLKSANDTATKTVGGSVTQGAVVALDATDASAQGDYKATALTSSSSWETTLSTGGFSWNYPIRTPKTAAGLDPEIALSYSSQTIDGRNSATNNQGSWIGEGFTYEPGYIERRFKPCAEDGHSTSAERCWAHQNATMMLGGHAGELVKVNDDTWKLAKDDGSLIQRLHDVNTGNGDDDGEHWKLTTTDGRQYYFGLNRLPGWTSGKTETNSTWSAPVYGDDSGEPCYKSSGFSASYCDQAWRWNLDYVIDPRDNVTSFYYDKETGYYAQNGRTDVNGSPYTRAGYLTRIEYGQRNNQVYTTTPAARVVFTPAERCLKDGSGNCTSYPDVPEDLVCAPNTHCKATQAAVTFFTRKKLVKISTDIWQGGAWSPVESWALEHDFKSNDDASRTLWLKQIIHSGHRGGSTISEPPVQLDGIQLPNRIDRDNDGIGPLVRYRLATIKTESGAQISVNYKSTDCDKNSLPTPGSSTKRCYPVIWYPFGPGDENKVTDWFQKYVVDSVVTDDLVGGNPDMVTSYEYAGAAAWAKAKPDGITKDADLTWDDWRGYANVIVRTGDGQVMPTKVEHVLLRGMGGTVSDSTGKSYTDQDGWAGHELETIVYNGPDVVSKTIAEPWRHVTRTNTETWGTREAAFTRTEVVRKLTAVPGGQWRETKTVSSFDTSHGRLTQMDDLGDVAPGKDDDDQCTRTWYADSTTKYMYNYISRTQTVSVKCATTANLATQLMLDDRTSYDLQAWGAGPTSGIRTRTEELDRYDGTNILYIPKSETTTLDGNGRATAVKDALGNVTKTEYTDVNGLTTSVKSTSALGAAYITTTTRDPAYGAQTAIVDANGKRTDLTYDAFGRLTAVWLPNRNKSQGATPNMKYTYLLRPDKTTAVTTESINNDGTYRASYELFDGMLRSRQTQSRGQSGGWLLTDTYYLGTGAVAKTNAAYLALGTPGDTPIVVADGSVNGQTAYVYDGAGRTTTETFSVAGTAQWSTVTTYQGDRTDVDPPAGGIPTTTVTDALGRTTDLYQYTGSAPSGAADVTHYTYTSSGSLDTVTDALGNKWDYDYNQRNQKVMVKDPDGGDTEYGYDAAGNVSYTKDARNIKISNKYDAGGRKVETWRGDVGTGTKLTAYTYDTRAKGQLYSVSRYTPTGNYSTKYETLDSLYRPITTRYWVPGADVGSIQANVFYDFTTAYNLDGTVQSQGMPAAGGLSAEAVVTSYDSLLRPTTLTGTTSYVTATSYGNTGELLQAELYTGGTNKKAWLNWSFERGTNRLLGSRLDRQGVATSDEDTHYRYDAAGNILSIADTPAGGQRDIQCFKYDYLRRMEEAWSTANTDADPCQAGPVSIGGPAPYHQSWTFEKNGNRKTETQFGLGGAQDTVRTYTYPAQGQGQNRPHAISKVEQAGPSGPQTFTYGYDAVGNTKDRPGQTLTWDDEGHLASSTPAGGQATNYIYDSNGNRLVRKEPGVTTIYLPGMELRLDTGTNVLSGKRFYVFAGNMMAVRSAVGVFFEATDHHGTSGSSIDAATGAITTRRMTPYGTVRGAAPASWPDEKGFVGGTRDGTTGLTHLGAREYDPLIGAFIALDPEIDFFDPQTLQGYLYSNNSPITFSDPTGRAWGWKDWLVAAVVVVVVVAVIAAIVVAGPAIAAAASAYAATSATASAAGTVAAAAVEGAAAGSMFGGGAALVGGAAAAVGETAAIVGTSSAVAGIGGGSLAACLVACGRAVSQFARGVYEGEGVVGEFPGENPQNYQSATSARDVVVSNNPTGKGKTTTGVTNTETGQTAGARSGNGNCAEGNACLATGMEPTDPGARYSQATKWVTDPGDQSILGVRNVVNSEGVNTRMYLVESPICTGCQGRTTPNQYPPGTKYDPHGPWSEQLPGTCYTCSAATQPNSSSPRSSWGMRAFSEL